MKRKQKMGSKRVLAFLLSAAMVLSTFMGTGFYSYGAEAGQTVVQEENEAESTTEEPALTQEEQTVPESSEPESSTVLEEESSQEEVTTQEAVTEETSETETETSVELEAEAKGFNNTASYTPEMGTDGGGRNYLSLNERENGEKFTTTWLTDFLDTLEEGTKFQHIDYNSYCQENEDMTMNKDIFNMLIPYLGAKEGDDFIPEINITFEEKLPEGGWVTWCIPNPEELTADFNGTLETSIRVTGERFAGITLSEQINTGGNTAGIFMGSAGFKNLCNTNYTTEEIRTPLFWHNDQMRTPGIQGEYCCRLDGEQVIGEVSIYPTDQLEGGMTYYGLSSYQYWGEIVEETWDIDGKQVLVKRLNISERAAKEANESSSFTAADIIKIIQNYDEPIDIINIIYESQNKAAVYKNIVNEIVSKSHLSYENIEPRIEIGYEITQEEGTYYVNTSLINPTKATADKKINIDISTDLNLVPAITIKDGGYPAERVELCVESPTAFDGLLSDLETFDWQPRAVCKDPSTAKAAAPLSYLGTGWAEQADYDGEDKGVRFVIENVNAIGKGTCLLIPYSEDEIGFGESKSGWDLNGVGLIAEPKYNWSVSDTEVLSVNPNAVVTGLLPDRDAFLMVKGDESGEPVYRVIHLWVSNQVLELLVPDEEIEMVSGDNRYVDWFFYPASSGTSKVRMVSADTDIVEVKEDSNQQPYLLAHNAGETTVTLTAYAEEAAVEDENSKLAEKTITVKVLSAVTQNTPENIYAIRDLGDMKLKDVELPEGFSWVAPDTDITANYEVKAENFYPAYYQITGSEKKYFRIPIQFIWGDYAHTQLQRNLETAVLGSEYYPILIVGVFHGSEQIGEFAIQCQEEYTKTVWVDSMEMDFCYIKFREDMKQAEKKNPFFVNVTLTNGKVYKDDSAEKTYIQFAKAGNAALTFAVKRDSTLLGTVKQNVKVTANTPADYQLIATTGEGKLSEQTELTEKNGAYQFTYTEAEAKVVNAIAQFFTSEGYGISTWSSSNPKVAVVSKEIVTVEAEEGSYAYQNQLSIKGTGAATITVTANDPQKTSKSFSLYVSGEKPILLTNKFTMNKAATREKNTFSISMIHGSEIADYEISDDFTLDKENLSAPSISMTDEQAEAIKTGKKKLTLTVTMKDGKKYAYPVEITVIDKKPKITLKQLEKGNIFYTDERGWSIFEVANADGTNVSNSTVASGENGKEFPYNYQISEMPTGTYLILKPSDVEQETKKGIFTCTVDGYRESVSVKFTVKEINKAPSLKLSKSSETIFPDYGITSSATEVRFDTPIDATGTAPEVAIVNEGSAYEIAASSKKISFSLREGETAPKSEKISFTVKTKYWSKPIKFTYTIKSSSTISLVNSNRTLTLSRDASIYRYLNACSTLSLKGGEGLPKEGEIYVEFKGVKEKDQNILNKGLRLFYDSDKGKIVAGLIQPDQDNTKVEKGTYNYTAKVYYRTDNQSKEILLGTVKQAIVVEDKEPQSYLSVKTSGKIDVLARDDSYVTCSVKVNKLPGEIEWVGLSEEGKDSYLFEGYEYADDGKLHIRALDEGVYETKTYQVRINIVISNEYGGYEILSRDVPVKVTEGKVKIDCQMQNNGVFYDEMSGETVNYSGAAAGVTITAGGRKINCDEVKLKLLNYTEDFKILEPSLDYEGTTFPVEVIRKGFTKTSMPGKTCTLKVQVTLENKAVNTKPQTFTIKIKVK